MVPMTFVGPKIYICNDGRLPMGGENYAYVCEGFCIPSANELCPSRCTFAALRSRNSDLTCSIVALGTRMPVLLAEFLVLALTWVKTYRSHRDAWRLGIASSLATCLIRDGASSRNRLPSEFADVLVRVYVLPVRTTSGVFGLLVV